MTISFLRKKLFKKIEYDVIRCNFIENFLSVINCLFSFPLKNDFRKSLHKNKMSYLNQKTFILTTIFLTGISIFLHFYRFPSVPNGFYIDESSIAYNAYCISKTGADEYCVRFPVFFRCFDNYHDTVYVYTLVPFISLFGMEIWVERLPAVIFKLLASFALFFLAKRIIDCRWISLFTAFVFSILPWTFVLGRTGMSGYMPMLLGLIIFVHFFIAFMDSSSNRHAIFAGVAFAFSMYSHNIGRPMTSLIFLALVAAYNIRLLDRKKAIVIFAITLIIALIPMILYVASTPESLSKRFSTLSIWKDGAGLPVVLGRFFSRYFQYFGLKFLFINGDLNLRHNTSSSGELYFVTLPFLLIGLWRLIKNFRKNPISRFILFALAVYPIAASLTVDRYHSTRCINGAPFFCLIAAVGLRGFTAILRRKRLKFNWHLLLLAIFAVESTSYMFNYFGDYVEESRSAFNAPLIEIIEAAFRERKNNETVFVSDSLFHHPVDKDFKPVWYSHFLFFGKIDPLRYQKEGIPPEIVSHYEPKKNMQGGLLLKMNSRIIFDSQYRPSIILNEEAIPEGAKLVKKIPLVRDSDRFFELYRF